MRHLARNARVQRAARDVLHHHEVDALLFADVVDGDDIGMIERRCGLRFLDEPQLARCLTEIFRTQHLDRDETVQPRVPRFEHFAHAARAQRFEDLIVAEGAAGHFVVYYVRWPNPRG